jgi:hypothetical protein
MNMNLILFLFNETEKRNIRTLDLNLKGAEYSLVYSDNVHTQTLCLL